MSGATQQILLHKLQEAIRRADKTLQSEPPLSSPFTDWKSWKERADDAELVLKQRLTGVNSRTMSDTDSANIARIKHEMAKAKENYEHAQWIANDTAAPSPKVSTSFIAKQEPGDEENMTAGGSLHHPLSTVSAPTPVRFEKKLPNPITLNPPCEACRADSLTCIREYIRRGRVRCDRCVTKGYRCSFPAGRSQALSAAQTPVIADSEAPRPQRKRTIPFNEDNAESPFGKRTRAYPPPSQIINVIDDDEPIPASAPPRIQGRRNLKEPSSSTNAINGNSLRGKAPGGSERKALMKMIIREREIILEKTTAIVDEVFDRIIEEMEGSS